MLTSLQALLRLAAHRWLGAFICALAMLLSATSTASAHERVQPKTRVGVFELARPTLIGAPQLASLERYRGFSRLQLRPCLRPAPLWSWPGNNPFRWRDPSGRIGFDGASTDRAIGAGQDWGDPAFQRGMMQGAAAGALLGVGALFASIEAGAWGLVSSLVRSPVAVLRVAGAAAGGAALSVKNCSGDGIASSESMAARASLTGLLRSRALQQAGFSTEAVPIVIDNSIGVNPTRAATQLREMGINARSVGEIFGKDPGDAAIRNLAESIGGRVLAADRGRDIGGGFGQAAIKTRQSLGVGDFARLIEEALR